MKSISMALVGLLLAPNAALACSVCQDPNDPRSGAYFSMTIFLSLFPLFAMGIVGFWLYRRFQEVEAAGTSP